MTNYNKKNRKDDIRLLMIVVSVFLLVAWLCSPPGNKFLQICFWGNNTKLFIAKMLNNSEVNEYMFYRNNAVYLAKMFPKDKKKAVNEINKAIATIPSYVSDKQYKELYKDRAYIELYYGDYKSALNDFLRSGELSYTEYLPVALLFKELGDYRKAIPYCNAILNIDSTAYAGFVCLSEIYSSANRPDVALKIWDVAIDRKPNNARFYLERSKVKTMLGQYSEAEKDVNIAKSYMPNLDTKQSLVQDTLKPKILSLTIK